MRFTAHLDLAQAWERLLRRARLPVAYTQGYNPQPRFNLAAALPLGFTSQCEMADIWFDGETILGRLVELLNAAAPPGITVHDAWEVDLKEKALQAQLLAIEYRVLTTHPADLTGRIEALLAAASLIRDRRGKEYDLRPLVEDVWLDQESGEMWMRLSARPGGTGRPDEVLEALGLDPLAAQVHRTRLIFTPQ